MKMMVISINKLNKSLDVAISYGIKVIAFLAAGITIHCFVLPGCSFSVSMDSSTIALLGQ